MRVATVQDLSCFGKCALTMALPVLSAMGHETSVLPTALLSTHTGGLGKPYVRDLTADSQAVSYTHLILRFLIACYLYKRSGSI